MSKKQSKNVQLILTANRLEDGIVIYFTGEGWSADIEHSLVSWDGDFLINLGEKTIVKENVIGLDTIKIQPDESCIKPMEMREKIRSIGPSIAY